MLVHAASHTLGDLPVETVVILLRVLALRKDACCAGLTHLHVLRGDVVVPLSHVADDERFETQRETCVNSGLFAGICGD